jgi:NADP-reducing hydrogenase subunit HndB
MRSWKGETAMPKLNRDSLQALRNSKRRELARVTAESGEVRIVVGMGTCGIAAGSLKTYGAFQQMLSERDSRTITLKQSGCMGLCHSEPTVEVSVPGMPSVIYGNVDESTAEKIMDKHIDRKIFLNHRICDRPAPDILEDIGE